MNEPKLNPIDAPIASVTSQPTDKQTEKRITSEILERLAVLLVADSPMRSAVQQHADKLRGKILAALKDQLTRDAFLDSRKILVELAKLLTRCQNRDQLAKALNYIKSLNTGDVMITANDPREEAMRNRLRDYLLDHSEWVGFILEDELDEIINIVRFVGFDPIH
ncbi:hypothetical protein [Fibrella aquatica]|uniref:hypothetical protein n=1 Tax=Fibrella aquatica TaxID=3242487 RepID=UPI0035202E58